MSARSRQRRDAGARWAWLWLLAAAPGAQEPAPEEDPARAFAALDEREQGRLVAEVERRLMLDPDPRIQAIVSWQRLFGSYPLATPRSFHDPEVWAPGVAPARTVVPEGTPEHRAVREEIPEIPFLEGLHAAVWYDWGRGEIVRREQPLTPAESFANLLAGHPPGTDEAVAHVLARLDTEPEQRPVAAYLEHLYAGLDARVYEGVTLYEAWYAEAVIDVPDVDAVPFAREILETKAYRSPIPAGRKRTRLYERIRDAAFAHRRYRTLRQAAAAAYVAAEPRVDATYAPLVPRFHLLWARHDDDPEALAAALAGRDREELLAEVDATIAEDLEAHRRREERRRALEEMAATVRGQALHALARRG